MRKQRFLPLIYMIMFCVSLCLILSACERQTADAVDRLMGAVDQLKGNPPRDIQAGEQTWTLEDLGEYAILFDDTPHTLDKIKRIAVLAGYEVSDGYAGLDVADAKDGFTVYIPWEGGKEAFPIVECKNDRTAEQNADRIDDEDELVALQYMRFLSACSAEADESDLGVMLALIMVGDPVFLDTMSMFSLPDNMSDPVRVNERPVSPLDGFVKEKAGEQP